MHFDPGEIRHGEHFREQRAHIVEMRENAFGIGVAFAAENFVAVDGKAVEKSSRERSCPKGVEA